MAQTDSEKVKIYVVIALLIVAGFVAYWRFGPKKGQPSGAKAGATGAGSSFVIPELPAWLADFDSPLTTDRAPYAPPSRDIFKPANEAPASEKPTHANTSRVPRSDKPEVVTEKEALPQLSAVMMGAGEGLAVIDGEIFRVGESVGEYIVESIQRKRVVLRKGETQITLTIGAR